MWNKHTLTGFKVKASAVAAKESPEDVICIKI